MFIQQENTRMSQTIMNIGLLERHITKLKHKTTSL